MPRLIKSRQNKLRRALRVRHTQIPPEVERLGNALWDEEDALDHEECIAALPSFVTAEADGLRVAELYPDIKRHLDRCDSCAEQYVDLFQVALVDVGDAMPQPEALPKPDLNFLEDRRIGMQSLVVRWAKQILATLSPQQLPGFELVSDVFIEQAEALGGKFSLQAMTVRGQEPGGALAALALTFAAVESLRTTLTPHQIDQWSRAGTLEKAVEASALNAAQEIKLDPESASMLAREFAAQVAKDPASLRALVE
jgi:hypothetical protein